MATSTKSSEGKNMLSYSRGSFALSFFLSLSPLFPFLSFDLKDEGFIQWKVCTPLMNYLEDAQKCERAIIVANTCLHALTCAAIAQNLDSIKSRVIWTPMAAEREREREGSIKHSKINLNRVKRLLIMEDVADAVYIQYMDTLDSARAVHGL